MNKSRQAEIDSLRKDLHDGVGSTFSQIAMLSYYGRLQEKHEDSVTTFSNIAELANNALAEMRQKIYEKENALEAAVKYYANTLFKSHYNLENKPFSLLIVEDNHTLAITLKALLQNSTAIGSVETFESAEEVLTFLQSITPDLLLVDLGLPGMGGVELIKTVSSNFPAIAIMVYTSCEDNPTVFAALKGGAWGYILKETPPEELIEALIVLKNGGAPMTPRIAHKVLLEFQQNVSSNESLLSAREEEIVKLIEQSLSYSQVSERLGISPNTVHSHIKKIYKKLQASGRSDVIKKAREIGVI